MPLKNSWKRILWAVDPFLSDSKVQISALCAIEALTKNEKVPVEPVYVMNQFPLATPIALTSDIVAQTQEAAQEELNDLTYPVKLDTILPLKVLSHPYRTQKEIAEEVINYAKSSDSNLIVVSTHAKKGLRRWFAGSFVENLMLYSDVPLFTVNPRWNSVAEFRHILFPTDFSEESLQAFESVLEFARFMRSDLTIFHKLPYLLAPEIETAFSGYSIYKGILEDEIQVKHAEAKKLAERAEREQVTARIYIDYRIKGSIAETVLHLAKRRHSLIAMAARSGKITASLFGSSTRKVVRGASYPVWVIHPHHKKVADVRSQERSPLSRAS